jgi:hypothetical protein
MDFLPVIIYALALGAGTPGGVAMVDRNGSSLCMEIPSTFIVENDVEAQWGDLFFLGGKLMSKSGTEYNNGFKPLQTYYSVYAGASVKIGDIHVSASIEHTCDHPQSIYEKTPIAWGVYGATNELTVKFLSGEFANR